MDKDITAAIQEESVQVEFAPVVVTQISEKMPEIQFDGQIATDQLLARVIFDLSVGIQIEHQSQFGALNNSQQINTLFNALLALRDAHNLLCVEVIHGSILLSRIWMIDTNQITFDKLAKRVIGALVLAHRCSADIVIPNCEWARVLGLNASIISKWVDEILDILHFEVTVEPEEYRIIKDAFVQQQ
ncbi:MAG: hypothetical protein EZS28_024098 [Streblomastix strix]|uniref:Cyclin N-terminal domain-containing protein n=1 Tax=Streblomastix strix TaxID=222440 RepID=A0A5J4VD31_9EUKA|nr:MAG: hypothetical protein EZS28_024098 [Streblomastix strix]